MPGAGLRDDLDLEPKLFLASGMVKDPCKSRLLGSRTDNNLALDGVIGRAALVGLHIVAIFLQESIIFNPRASRDPATQYKR